MPSTEQTITVPVPPVDFMDLLTDFASYPSFLPDMESVTLLRQSPGEWEVRFTIQVIRPFSYTLHLTQTDPLTLRWSLINGLFRTNVGGWSLSEVPQDDASGPVQAHTRATYQIDIQMGMFVPINIIHSLIDPGLPQTLQHFRQEAIRRFDGTDATA